ncbi:Protein CBG00227 [Caenorhabditis briggsae]|uniref:Protein CBG00227 n=1 Tax=Caenorhabditis briggsae TaxID=6238 RepID=A8WMI1_CAEBR|nr:Protein CBG00227 [Caenorhabditis briggsae]CAP21686.2 Protein CBG00227 [Caenorhabditis briggsae]
MTMMAGSGIPNWYPYINYMFLELYLRKNPISCYTQGTFIIQRYRVVSRLGYGSFGTVFKVHDSSENDALQAAKVARKEDDNTGKFETEVAALKKCIGLVHWPQMSNYFETKSYRIIILSLEGESINDILSRKNNKVFTNDNCLRISFALTKALHSLHGIGYLHRDINDNNVMIKKVGKEVVVRVIDLGNSAPCHPRQKCDFHTYTTSYHVTIGKEYCERDDLVSAMYLMSDVAGAQIFDTAKYSFDASKKRFHASPTSFFSGEQKWMGQLIEMFDTMEWNEKKPDMTRIWKQYEQSIPEVSPTSPIKYKDIDNVIVID